MEGRGSTERDTSWAELVCSARQLLHVHTHTWPRMMYAPAYQPVAIYKHRRKRIREGVGGGESDRDGTIGQPGRGMKKERGPARGKRDGMGWNRERERENEKKREGTRGCT